MPLLHIDVPPGWTVVAGRQQVRAVMLAAGGEVAAKARAMIRSGSRKGPSKPGEPPHSVSGKLARSIRARAWKDGEGVTVRASEFNTLFLSLGAKGGGGNTVDKGNMTMDTAEGPMSARKGAGFQPAIVHRAPGLPLTRSRPSQQIDHSLRFRLVVELRSCLQRCSAIGRFHVHVGFGVDKRSHNLDVSVARRFDQRRPAVLVFGIHVCLGIEERAYHVGLSVG